MEHKIGKIKVTVENGGGIAPFRASCPEICGYAFGDTEMEAFCQLRNMVDMYLDPDSPGPDPDLLFDLEF